MFRTENASGSRFKRETQCAGKKEALEGLKQESYSCFELSCFRSSRPQRFWSRPRSRGPSIVPWYSSRIAARLPASFIPRGRKVLIYTGLGNGRQLVGVEFVLIARSEEHTSEL